MVSLRIALRYLISKKKYHAVNIISVVSMAGVAVATLALVCVLSVFNGFSDMTLNQVSQLNPDIKVTPLRGKIINRADSLASRLATADRVQSAMTVIEEQALAVFNGRQVPVNVIGVPEDFTANIDIESLMLGGIFTLDHPTLGPAAALSASVAMSLEVYPNTVQPLYIYVPGRTIRYNPAIPMAAFRCDTFAIAGVYESYRSEEQEASVIVNLDIARQLFDMPDQASAIYLTLSDTADEAAVIKSIEQITDGRYKILNRLQQADTSLKMISIEKWVTFLMLAFILLIASFNVISTLSMLIIEKNNDIGILRAMGATRTMLRRIFMWQGWLVTAIGGLIGTIVGCTLCIAQQHWGFIKLNGDAAQLTITSYPVRLDLADVTIVLLLVIAVGYLISLLTSRIALR